jgi:DNA polymerase-1
MRVVLDIETCSKAKKIHLVVTKDIDTGKVQVWKEASSLQAYIKDATLIIGQNIIGFDAPILNRTWGTKIRLKTVFDTLIASRLLEPSREHGHSLEAWGKTLGKEKIDYAIRWEELAGRKQLYRGECFDDPFDALLVEYCIGDVEVTELLYNNLTSQLKKKEFSDESIELEHQVAAIVSQQERNGFKLDIPYSTSLLADIKGRMAEVYESMQQRWPAYELPRVSEKTGKSLKPKLVEFNPGSRKQIGEKLIELGWKPETFTETGQPQVDEGVLSKLSFPEAKMIAEYLMLQKRVAQIESWMEALGEDNRVHGRVITNGAVTGRMTHHSPNMAQIPNSGSIYGHECRECWTVEDGNVLVGCDASGLELRMLAHYMKDEDYVRTVCEGSSKDGTDIHSVNQRAAGLPTRDNAKTFVYAFMYGAGDAKIGSIIGGSAKDGAKLKSKFLAQTPALARLLQRVSVQASKGWVPGLDGRRIWVRSEHAALNSLLQGAGAIVMKKALVLFNDKIKANKWPVKFVANVHDEMQFECHPDIAELAGKAAKQSIIDAGTYFKLRCPLDGEYKVGRSWRDTH